MKTSIKELRQKYIDNLPEEMTSEDILNMSEEALLDMNYCLNNDEFDDNFSAEDFYIF